MKRLLPIRLMLFLVVLLLGLGQVVAADAVRQVIPAIPPGRMGDDGTMQQIYNEVQTPYKYGVVLKGDNTNDLVDCPSVFRYGRHWYMMYVLKSKLKNTG